MSSHPDIRDKTITGLSWTAASQVIGQSLGFILSILMARVLMPEHFGILAMVSVFTRFASVFSNLGFNSALIQGKNMEDRHFSTIFWVNLITGSLITITVCGLAYGIAAFYSRSDLILITQVISLNFLLIPCQSTHAARLRRDLNFKAITIIGVISLVAKGSTGLALAYNGYGVWSLIYMEIAGELIAAVCMWVATGWVPRFTYDHEAFKELFTFSRGVLGFNIVNYWARNADNLLIGRFLGEVSLGVFNKAYSLMLLPLNQVTWVISQVMFPSLSKIKNDLPRVRKIYLKTTAVIFLITAPMMLGLMVTAPHAIPFLLGNQWVAMVPILRILCPLGVLQSTLSTVGWIYLSQGRSDIMFKWALFSCPIVIAGFAIGICFGSVRAVAVSYLVTTTILFYPALHYPCKIIRLPFVKLIKNFGGLTFCSVSMALIVWCGGALLPNNLSSHVIYLSVQIPLGIVSYFLLLYVFRIEAFQDLIELVRERIRSRK